VPVAPVEKITFSEVEVNRRRGGRIRVLVGPRTAGARSGFLGTVDLSPGEYVSEHYHPYSEEFLIVLSGRISVRVDGEPLELEATDSLLVPLGARHRLDCLGDEPARAAFFLSPLAPRPELGHVDTEPLPEESGDRDREVHV
jgi:putative monooxygenase